MTPYVQSKLKLHLPRILLGVIFIISGVGGFFKDFPGPELTTEGQSFIREMKESGYLWTLLKIVEIVGGTLLISKSLGRFGVLLLAPVTVGIVWFHLTVSLKGAWLGFVAFGLELLLIIMWRKNLARMFHVKRTHPPHTSH